MTRLLLLAVITLAGCASAPSPIHSVVYGTHRVWLNPSYMTWEDSNGYGCGHVERNSGGWVYTASLVGLGPNGAYHSVNFNSFDAAVADVEKWCRP